MKLETLRSGVGSFLDSVADGWRHLRDTAANALTRFLPGEQSQLPERGTIDDPQYLPSRNWSMLGGEVFEDDSRLIVRVEIPGMDKADMNVEVCGDALVISGEKRFSSESSAGRWRVMQCAYGSFRRVVPLPSTVLPDGAQATYTKGVLRVELPKATPGHGQRRNIPVR